MVLLKDVTFNIEIKFLEQTAWVPDKLTFSTIE